VGGGVGFVLGTPILVTTSRQLVFQRMKIGGEETMALACEKGYLRRMQGKIKRKERTGNLPILYKFTIYLYLSV